MKKVFRYILPGILLAILLLAIIFHQSLYYGFVQARGQLSIIFHTVPVSEVMADPGTPDSIKTRIREIGEVKQFARGVLGLKAGRNYTTYYDQKPGTVMWVLTACDPFDLRAFEWHFPVIGKFSYKGYFDRNMALAEEQRLKERGYDTSIGTAGGWSTLGILKDPILSGMLDRDEDEIADLIIHELTHATIFIHDSVEFNENLATFIGNYGTLEYLKAKYGPDSPEYNHYDSLLSDRIVFNNYILRSCYLLDSLYHSFGDGMSSQAKIRQKDQMIRQIVDNIDTLHFSTGYFRGVFHNREIPNNTYFMSYMRYRAFQSYFISQFEKKYKNDLPAYIIYLKKEFD